MSRQPSLFLFDIDGTLLRAGTAVHRDSFGYAFRAVFDLPLSLDGISAAGRTDRWLLAEPLRRAGVSTRTVRERMPAAFAAMETYTEQHLGDLRHCVLPGVPEVLSALQASGELLGLLTGNLRRIAFAKLSHAGLDGYFEVGGFGEESERRSDLVPVALTDASRAAGFAIPAGKSIVIGDTPLDIGAGREHGTRTAGVATGPFTEEQLRASGADLVLPSFADPAAVAALLHLR